MEPELLKALSPLADDAAMIAMKAINPPQQKPDEFTNPKQRKVTGTMIPDESINTLNKTSMLLQRVGTKFAEQGFALPTISPRDPFAKKNNSFPNNKTPQANTNIKGLGDMGYGGFKGAFLEIPGFKKPIPLAKTSPNQIATATKKTLGVSTPSPQLNKTGEHPGNIPFSGGSVPVDHNPAKYYSNLSQRLATDEAAKPIPDIFRKNIFGYFVEKKALLGTLAAAGYLLKAPLVVGKVHAPTGRAVRRGIDFAEDTVNKIKEIKPLKENVPNTALNIADKAIQFGQKQFPTQGEKEFEKHLALEKKIRKPMEERVQQMRQQNKMAAFEKQAFGWGHAVALGVPLLASGFVAGAFNPAAGNFMRRKVLGTWSKNIGQWLPEKANIGGLNYNPRQMLQTGVNWARQKYTPFTTEARLGASSTKTQENYFRRFKQPGGQESGYSGA